MTDSRARMSNIGSDRPNGRISASLAAAFELDGAIPGDTFDFDPLR
jgi:hypothetical protein